MLFQNNTPTLNTNFQVSNGDEPDYWIQFESSKYMLLFQDGRRSNSGAIENYQLTDFLIKDNSTSFTIKGVNIKIGDNISKLGNSNALTVF